MGEGYFSISFEAIVGLLVTIVGIWLVVRQLHEAKLASQMGGLLTLEQMALALAELDLDLLNRVASDEWQNISAEEAHQEVFENPKAYKAWNGLVAWNDLLGVLVRRGALDEEMVFLRHGPMTELWYQRFEKIIHVERKRLKWDGLAANWEWLVARNQKHK
jgi:hypothetical protein